MSTSFNNGRCISFQYKTFKEFTCVGADFNSELFDIKNVELYLTLVVMIEH